MQLQGVEDPLLDHRRLDRRPRKNNRRKKDRRSHQRNGRHSARL